MSTRRGSSPYPAPPTAYVRRLTARGWRRCDAESIAVVDFCLAHAADGGRSLPTLARHAAAALAREPVLAAAVLLFGPRRGTAGAALLLATAAGPGARTGLVRLREAAFAFGLATEVEEGDDGDDDGYDEDWYDDDDECDERAG